MNFLVYLSILLSAVSVVVSAISWSKIVHFSLPCPVALPIISTFTPIVGPFLILLVSRIKADAKERAISMLKFCARHLLPLLPFAAFILSLVYGVPSDLISCGLESQWRHLFSNKDEALKRIENSLLCCGYNSPRHMPWPFPSDGVGVDACERTLGFTTRCSERWRAQEQIAAGMIALASLFSFIVLHLVDLATQDEGGSRRAWFMGARAEQVRLLRGADEEREQGYGGGNSNIQNSYSGEE